MYNTVHYWRLDTSETYFRVWIWESTSVLDMTTNYWCTLMSEHYRGVNRCENLFLCTFQTAHLWMNIIWEYTMWKCIFESTFVSEQFLRVYERTHLWVYIWESTILRGKVNTQFILIYFVPYLNSTLNRTLF